MMVCGLRCQSTRLRRALLDAKLRFDMSRMQGAPQVYGNRGTSSTGCVRPLSVRLARSSRAQRHLFSPQSRPQVEAAHAQEGRAGATLHRARLCTKDASVIGPAMSSLLSCSILPLQQAQTCDVNHASLISRRVLASVRGQRKGRQHDAIRGNGEPNLSTRGSSDDDLLRLLRLHQFHRPGDGTSRSEWLR